MKIIDKYWRFIVLIFVSGFLYAMVKADSNRLDKVEGQTDQNTKDISCISGKMDLMIRMQEHVLRKLDR